MQLSLMQQVAFTVKNMLCSCIADTYRAVRDQLAGCLHDGRPGGVAKTTSSFFRCLRWQDQQLALVKDVFLPSQLKLVPASPGGEATQCGA